MINKIENKQSNFIMVFGILYCMALVIPIVLAYRPVSMGFFHALPGGALIFPSTYLFGDIISEVYGYKIARQILWCSIGAEILFAVTVTLVIYSPYPQEWHDYQEYIIVLGHSIRFVIASILGTTISEFINIYIICKLKIYYKGKHFWLRSFISSASGEFVLTIIVYSITYYAVFAAKVILTLMLFGYIYKVIFSSLAIFPAVLIANFLKRNENIDIYDYNTNFNPFHFRLNRT